MNGGFGLTLRNMDTPITLREGRKTDATVAARLIMEAMRPECCRHFYGESHTSEEFHELLTALAEREHTQYSYHNTICATNADGAVVGILVCYDGARLLQLRRPFVEEVKRRFGRDFSDMPEETSSGELYLDSAAVAGGLRGHGIATRLFHAAAERARRMGIPRLGLLVDRGNPDAERLYRRMGFVHVGDRDWGGHTLKHMQLEVARPL